MKVSIITATYNSALTVRDTLQSVAAQTWPYIEHIIVDGGSKDETLPIVEKFPHVAKVIAEPDRGLYDAMNKGIRAATGDLIAILNSDDFYSHAAVIENIVAHLMAQQSDCLYADLQFVDALDTQKITRTWRAGNFKRENFLLGWMPPHPTFFVKKEVYQRYGLFNLDFKTAADYELMLRYLYKNGVSVCYWPEVIVKMRTGGQSTASIKNRIKANREDRQAWICNQLKPRFYTLYLKPLLKVPQFLFKERR